MAAENAEIAAKPLANAKHESVLQGYLADPERVGYRCYTAVYPKSGEAAAKTAFSRLLKNADFAARLEFLKAGVAKVVSEKVAITVERVIDELAKLGFSNMENYMRADAAGVPRLKFSELTSDQKAALQEVTCEEEILLGADDEKPSVLVRKTKFKLYDKRAALVSIGQHLGAFVEKHKHEHEHTGAGGGPIDVDVQLTDLDLARRIAFALEKGARAPRPAAAPKKKKGKPA